MKVGAKIKTAAISAAINTALGYLEKDPENNAPKLMDMIDKLVPADWYKGQRDAIREAINEKGNWFQLIQKIYALDPGVRKAFFTNFITNASLKGSALQEEVAEKNNCNVPWAILLDPTSACNLHCTGCWAAEYGHKLNLSLETIDSIIRQGKEMGTYMYIYTGGEPLVRKKDLIKICEMHPDCEFLSFTNGTLIDEEFCQEMLRVKNFVPAISLEGFEDANDSRRGQGVYEKVMHAMDLLLKPEQREEMYHRIREMRGKKAIFAMDFQNDGEFVGGCIAGGRRYLHINAKGAVEPCVFIHYSNANIHDCTLLEALKSPIFQAYHDNQPFNNNHLRPCPMLENPTRLRELVKETGAVNTDYEAPESVDHLCDKCVSYAENWKPTAEKLWEESHPCSGGCAGCGK